MPTVMIYQSPRPLELKRRTAAAIADALVDSYGLRPEQIQVYFHESDDESWGRGGLLATDQQGGAPGTEGE